MAPDHSPTHRSAAAPGHDAARPAAAGSAAAASFAERILGKYFVAPALRPGPSLVLRMLNRGSRSSPTAGAAKDASVASHPLTHRAARPVVRVAAAFGGAAAVEPPPGPLTARLPDLSRPVPPFGPRLLVQRKPLPSAASPFGAPAMTHMAPHPHTAAQSAARRSTAAASMPGPGRRQAPGGIAAPSLPGPGILVTPTSHAAPAGDTLPRATMNPRVIGEALTLGPAVRPRGAPVAAPMQAVPPGAQLSAQPGKAESTPLQPAFMPTEAGSVPNQHASRGPVPLSRMSRSRAYRLVPGAPLALRSTGTQVAGTTSHSPVAKPVHAVHVHAAATPLPLSAALPPTITPVHTGTPERVMAASFGSADPASGDAGTTPQGTSHSESQPVQHLALPGLHRLVQRKSLVALGAGSARLAAPAHRPAAAAATDTRAANHTPPALRSVTGLEPLVNPGPASLASAAQAGPLLQHQPPQRRDANPLVLEPSAFAAAPARAVALQFTTALPPTAFALGRDIASPNARTDPRQRPVHAPHMHGRVLSPSRPVQRMQAAAPMHAPGRISAAETPGATGPVAGAGPLTAVELSLRTARGAAATEPTVVAATLGATPPTPAAPADRAPNGNPPAQASSMPIQDVAERVFHILERRLIVERERRGLRS